MYSFSVFLKCDGDMHKLKDTLSSLEKVKGLEGNGKLVLLFKHKKYMLTPDVLSYTEMLSSVGANSYISVDNPNIIHEIGSYIKDNESDILFFAREGDIFEPYIFKYIDNFFKFNHDSCGVVFIPVLGRFQVRLPEAFQNLPKNGISAPDDHFPLGTRGAAVWGKYARHVGLQSEFGYGAFENMLKNVANLFASYGRINQVALRGEKQAMQTVFRKKYLVSCIIPIYKAEPCIYEAIDSVVIQTIEFRENVQLILVNYGNPDSCVGICKVYLEKYPENIVYIELENEGINAARNAGLDMAVGDFVTFLESSEKFEKNYLQCGLSFCREYQIDLVAFPIAPEHPLNKRFEDGTRVVDIENDYNALQGTLTGVLFRNLPDIRFSDSEFADFEFVHNIITANGKYGVCVGSQIDAGSQTNDELLLDVDWYNELLELCGSLLCVSQSRYTQYAVIYLLQWCNIRYIEGSDAYAQSWFEMLPQIISQVDDDIIASFDSFSHWKKFYLRSLRNDVFIDTTDTPCIVMGGEKFANLNAIARISVIEEYEGIITILGSCKLPDKKHIGLVAYYNNEIIHALDEDSDYEADFLIGQAIHKAYIFKFQFRYTTVGQISIFLDIHGYGFVATRIMFKNTARMCDRKDSFVVGDNCIIQYNSSKRNFDVFEYSLPKLQNVISEYVMGGSKAKSADVALANEYLNLYNLMSRKHIWLFADTIDHADDNAEHFFRYCSKMSDGIERYFAVEESSADYKRLQKYGNVVSYGSQQHKLLYLFAEKYISSNIFRHPFDNNEQWLLFGGLAKSKLVYLRHGIATYDLSGLLNKWNRNIKMLITSTAEEYQSILQNNNYGYDDSVVKLTGMPRFDNLYNEKTNKILFMPTWRQELFPQGIMSKNNPDFKDSVYAKTISELLTDQKLLDICDIYGYELEFCPHPIIEKHIGDIQIDERVKIADLESSYQDLFAKAALMITDYSSVAFDFAYLRKPVVYYHFAPSAEKPDPIDYENNGFGEVVTELDVLRDVVCQYLKVNCAISELYSKRVDECFVFSDQNNCKRTYDALSGMEENICVI